MSLQVTPTLMLPAISISPSFKTHAFQRSVKVLYVHLYTLSIVHILILTYVIKYIMIGDQNHAICEQ